MWDFAVEQVESLIRLDEGDREVNLRKLAFLNSKQFTDNLSKNVVNALPDDIMTIKSSAMTEETTFMGSP